MKRRFEITFDLIEVEVVEATSQAEALDEIRRRHSNLGDIRNIEELPIPEDER